MEEIKTIRYKSNTILNYKIKLPTLEGKSEALLNLDKEHYYVGGEVWICLWFRTGKMGNQVSLEYNRFSGEEVKKNNSNGNSIGNYFVESYFPIELIPFINKCLKIFQKIIGKKMNGYETSLIEFREIVNKELKEVKNETQTKII